MSVQVPGPEKVCENKSVGYGEQCTSTLAHAVETRADGAGWTT